MSAPPARIHRAAVRDALEAKLERLAREWANLPERPETPPEPKPGERPTRYRPAVLEIPVGSEPWATVLRFDPAVKDKPTEHGLEARAVAGIRAALAAWIASWPREACAPDPEDDAIATALREGP